MTSPEFSSVWYDGDAEVPKSFVGYLQVLSNKTTATIKSTALVAMFLCFVDELVKHKSSLANRKLTHCGRLPVSPGR